jgi:hypothetical protein
MNERNDEQQVADLNEALARWDAACQQEEKAREEQLAATERLKAIPEYTYWYEHWGKHGNLYPLINPPESSGLRETPEWQAYHTAAMASQSAEKDRQRAAWDVRMYARRRLPRPRQRTVTPRVSLKVEDYALYIDGEYVWVK